MLCEIRKVNSDPNIYKKRHIFGSNKNAIQTFCHTKLTFASSAGYIFVESRRILFGVFIYLFLIISGSQPSVGT